MKKFILILMILGLLVVTACTTHTHVVGKGAQGTEAVEATQWYAVWGLIPIGTSPDTNAMAGGAANYTIQTQSTVKDIIITMFTQYVTITRRTVTVTK
ncbi:MAG: hypothetical protein JW982_12240 [Spirochaetes bacterium]|nr:hypothetical protein [Spirochaetota bacterium]